ncbi:MAG: PorP/SprF family type IX secretion system membrane protein [Salibacteraceae bacterium]
MKNRILTILFFLGSLIPAVAQQQAQSSFDHVNAFNLNKAYAGLDSCMHVFLQHKQQWAGVDGAPVNTQFQGHLPIQNNMGVGLSAGSWKAGLLRSTHIAATLAKHLDVQSKYRVGAALSLGYAQHNFNVEDVVAFDNDAYLGQSAVNGGGVYADLNFLFAYDRIEVGVALPRLFNSAINLDVPEENNEFNPEGYLNVHGAYGFTLNSQWDLRPMAIYRSIPTNGAMVDIKAGLQYQKMLELNLGYRTNSGILAALDVMLNNGFRFGYAYDAGLTRLNGISGGSHEFLVGYRMCKPKREKKAPEPVYYFTSGNVTDAATGEALTDRTLTLRNDQTGATQTLTTDSLGFYEAQVDSSVSYTLMLDDADYESVSKTMRISPQQTRTTVNLPLTHKETSMVGQVIDAETKAPMAGVEVLLTNGEEQYSAITDAQGNFSIPFTGKHRGDALVYELTLRKEGYEEMRQNLEHTVQDYQPIAIDKVAGGALQLTKEKQPEQLAEIIDLNPIRFEVNSARLTPDAKVELDKVVKVLNENPEMRIEIGAHTDCTGGAEGNLRLSQKRAKSTLDYIQARIENPDRIDGQGYGETQPLSDCACGDCSRTDHELNRRTEFRIIR